MKSRLSDLVVPGIVVLLLVPLVIGLRPYLTAIFSALVFGPIFGLIGIVIGPILFSLVLETTRMFYHEQRETP